MLWIEVPLPLLQRGSLLDRVAVPIVVALLYRVQAKNDAARLHGGVRKESTVVSARGAYTAFVKFGREPVAPGEEVSDEDFKEKLETLNEELEALNAQAREREETIARNVVEILQG